MPQHPSSDPAIREVLVDAARQGQRLDQAAAELYPEFSRARLQRWIRDGDLTVNGLQGRAAARLNGGERLVLTVRLEPETELRPEAIALRVLFQDEHLLVLDKPAGLVVHPAAGHPDGTLQNALLHHDPGLMAVPRSGLVHRLDRETSGVMVVARSLTAHASLVEQLQARRMRRIYAAVAHGRVGETGTVNAPIARHPRDRQRMAVVEGGKTAISHYRVVRRFGHFSQLEVSLETGRTHQIRVHMQHLGFPLLGDPLYGKRLRANLRSVSRTSDGGRVLAPSAQTQAIARSFPRQALHAQRLQLEHPVTGEAQEFEADLPQDLLDLLEQLEREDPA